VGQLTYRSLLGRVAEPGIELALAAFAPDLFVLCVNMGVRVVVVSQLVWAPRLPSSSVANERRGEGRRREQYRHEPEGHQDIRSRGADCNAILNNECSLAGSRHISRSSSRQQQATKDTLGGLQRKGVEVNTHRLWRAEGAAAGTASPTGPTARTGATWWAAVATIPNPAPPAPTARVSFEAT